MASTESVGRLRSPTAERGQEAGADRWLLIAYAVTTFVSAFLLFQVEPLIGKFILPWYGGMIGVWTTCMLFFQVLLFAGYTYAHLVSSRLSPRTQATVHFVLLCLAACLLPIVPAASWKPFGNENPVFQIVCLLAVTVGLPFFALSSTGPLLQGWFSRTHPGRSPYRLYALSNAASLLALISYPFVVEPLLGTLVQARVWSGGFAVFAVLCAACAAGLARRAGGNLRATSMPAVAGDSSEAPSLSARCLWFALAMVPSILLLATTNQVCQDSASVPFLWILPLVLYLLSFILCFDGERWYSRRFLVPAAVISLAITYQVMTEGVYAPLIKQLVTYFSMLFLCAMVCHGELVRLKPAPRYLTSFYLLISAGGAAGGLFVGLVAPLLFKGFFELHIGLFGCAALIAWVLYADRSAPLFTGRLRGLWVGVLFLLGFFAAGLVSHATDEYGGLIDVERNFYGVLRVKTGMHSVGRKAGAENEESPRLPTRILMNGRILHGVEFEDEALSREPTTYYCRDSGVGRVLSQPHAKGRRVGLVGLGIGTLAAYGEPGDSFKFYEINPAVVRIANTYFHYLERCRAEKNIIVGDARLAMERETPQQFDVLVLDAFSGDAVPMHLLTREAFAIYLKHVAADGVIAVHISSRYFHLRAVVEAAADTFHLARAAVEVDSKGPSGFWTTWMLLSRNPDSLAVGDIPRIKSPPTARRIAWSDDHASLFEVLTADPASRAEPGEKERPNKKERDEAP